MNAQSPLESLLALVASVFDAHSAVLFQPDPDGQSASVRSWFSAGDAVEPGARIAPGRGLVGWILRNKAPLLVNAIEENQAYLGYYREDEEPAIHSFMGCPVSGGGALCIDSTRSQAFADSRQKLLHLFALMVPQLENMVSSSGHDREVASYFEALERMAGLRTNYSGWGAYLSQLLALLVEVTGFQYAAFASRVEGSPRYIVEGEFPELLNRQGDQTELPVNSGIVGWVFRNGEAVHNEGTNVAAATPVFGKTPLAPDFASAICLPVMVDRSTCGVLCLAGMEPRDFRPELRAFVRMAADEVARLLEVISLRYRVHSLMPRAAVQQSGGVVYDPNAPGRMPNQAD